MLDRKFNIVQFQNSHSIAGIPNKISFETLVHFFQKNKVVTAETVAEYHAASREDKQKFKDKGCFIMGETLGNRRRISDIQSRSMITLDIDYCPPNMIDIIKSKIGEKSEVNFPFCYYTTHGHTPEKPRLRLIVPLSEDISPELYPPIGKAIAQIIGMEYFDATTFDVNRVMHVPSVSQDGEYLTEGYGIGKVDLLNPEDMLNRYMDYKNISEFQKPIYISGLKTAKIEQGKVKSSKKTKYKIVNAFNSAYSIIEAIDTFLPDVYEKSKRAKDRYSYLGGESKDGLVIMSEEYAFSHHGTDPAQGRLLNAFDIVKIHKFGKFDVDYVENDDFKEYEKSQSYEKMTQFVKTLPNVMAFMPVQKKLERNAKEFHDDDYEFKKDPTSALEWRSTLDMVGKGDTEHPASNARNLKIIFENDEYLKDLFYYDGLKDTICFNRPPGWNDEKEKGSLVSDDDDSQIRVYLNSTYQIAGKDLIYDSVVHQASKKRIHPIRTFLANLPEWDGEERVETIICDLFDIVPNEFYREASKKWFVGLIERVMRPGSKFDMALTIIGEQGIGKSQFLKSLVTPEWGDGGMETFDTHDNFFSDTKIDFEKKDAYEQLVGVWLYELSEIEQYYTKSAVSVVKSFMSKTSDKYRKSYGRRVTEQKRQAVFAGTTNANKPLKDTSGNRRFLPFYSKMLYYTTRVYDTKFWTREIRDQVLAEALFYFNSGYRPMSPFCKEAMRIWEELNEKATVENEMKPLIEMYVENEFPINFFVRPLYEMQTLYPQSVLRDEAGFTPRRETRDEFSIKEIWCVLFKKDLSSTPDYRQREEIEKSLEELGFVRQPYRRSQGVFGQQTIYRRPEGRLLNDDELPF